MNCFCHSNLAYKACCMPLIQRRTKAMTPEALMRSRYTAFVKKDYRYIEKTMAKAALAYYKAQTKPRSFEVTYQQLQVIQTYLNPNDPNQGFVEFIATYQSPEGVGQLHELSCFEFISGQWFYVSGQIFAK